MHNLKRGPILLVITFIAITEFVFVPFYSEQEVRKSAPKPPTSSPAKDMTVPKESPGKRSTQPKKSPAQHSRQARLNTVSQQPASKPVVSILNDFCLI